MINNVLSDIGGVGIYGVISISIFFTVFIVMFFWAFSRKKPYLNNMSSLPLDDGEDPKPAKGISHE